ncbi:MAG: NAD(P)/FAD-dependent oxidoreductase, partial [Anaerolineae bacterium]
PAGVWAQADFPPVDGEPSYSLVVRRYELDDLLLDRVRALPGVTVREGFVVGEAIYEDGAIRGVVGHPQGKPNAREVIRAPLTVGADGMRSLFHGRYGITRTEHRRKRWGIAGHLRGVEELKPYIEVLFQEDHEIYLAPLGKDLALVAILLEKEGMAAFRGNLVQAYHDFLRAAPELGPRVRHSEVVPPVGGKGPLGFDVEPIFRPGLLLVGDSAGFIDAITGEGMTLALKSARAAAPVIRRAFDTGDFGDEVLAAYDRARAEAIDDPARLTRLLLNVSRSTLLTNQAIRHLSRDEALFQKMVGIVTGTTRYRDFSLRDRLALALG